jgi:tetratricopeptide (TPR) repeat protein
VRYFENIPKIAKYIGGYVLLIAAIESYVYYAHVGWIIGAAIPTLIFLLDAALTNLPKVSAFVFAERQQIALAACGICWAIAAYLAPWQAWLEQAPAGESFANPIWFVFAQFLIPGLVVGGLLRVLFTGFLANTITGEDVSMQKAYIAAGIAIMVWMFPSGTSHRPFAGLYPAGIGVGFLLHFALRNSEHKRAQFFRYAQNLLWRVNHQHLKLDYVLRRAVLYFARERWRRLNRLLLEVETNKKLSPELAIVKASMQRVRGNVEGAITTISDALVALKEALATDLLVHYLFVQWAVNLREQDKLIEADEALKKRPDIDLAHHLLVQLAVNLREQGKLIEADEVFKKAADIDLARHLLVQLAVNLLEQDKLIEADEALKKAADINAKCFLYRVTHGLRLADEICLYKVLSVPKPNLALIELQRAVQLLEQEKPSILEQVLGAAVPAHWTFFVDAYAYTLLKCGYHQLSRSLLVQCIQADPTYSSPYLHLGEWYLVQLRLRSTDMDYNKGRAQRLATLCLSIAKQLEGRRKSLTASKARSCLSKGCACPLHRKTH